MDKPKSESINFKVLFGLLILLSIGSSGIKTNGGMYAQDIEGGTGVIVKPKTKPPAPRATPKAKPKAVPKQKTAPPSAQATTPPLPLKEIFTQAGAGDEFLFINNDKPDSLVRQFTDAADCRHSGPYGLKLTYGFTGQGNGGWGVHWDNAPRGYLDVSRFTHLVFWVKGKSGRESFQVGLRDTSGTEVKVESATLVVNISDWSIVAVPLSSFRGVRTSSVKNVNFGFNDKHGAGSLCIDDIYFSK